MTTGLLDPAIVAFVFAPPVLGAALLVTLWWRRHHGRAGLDAPASVLVSVVRTMPPARVEWGAAMLAELAAVPGVWARWRFALGCATTALFPPHAEARLAADQRNPVLGLLAVALPPLGLPLIYAAAAVLEAIAGSPYASRWAEPELVTAVVKVLVVSTAGLLVAGVPLGLAGRWRRERMPWLTAWGIASSAGAIGHFLLGMRLLAGGE